MTRKDFKHFSPALTLLALLFVGIAVGAQPADRANTALALSLLDDAIAKQQTLIRSQVPGSEVHRDLTLRLLETLHSKAGILEEMKAAGRRQYLTTLVSLIDAINPFVGNCEKYNYCARAYSFRGRTWARLGKIDQARADYEIAVKRFASQPGYEKAVLYLAQMDMDEGNWAKALTYLVPLRHRADLPLHHEIVERLSWAYAAKGDYRQALTLTEYLIARVDGQSESVPARGVTKATLALNAAVFFARALEAHTPGMGGKEAASYLLSHVPASEVGISLRALPTLVEDPASLPELDKFREGLLSQNATHPAVWDAIREILLKSMRNRRLSSVYETLVSYQQYTSQQPELQRELPATLRRVEKNLLSLLAEEKEDLNSESRVIAKKALRQVYSLGVTGNDPLSASRFQFNLAALEFSEKNFAAARLGFRKVSSLADSRQTELQSLAKTARQEELKSLYRQLLALLNNRPIAEAQFKEILREWDGPGSQSLAAYREMNYEVSRLMYQGGLTEAAVTRLEKIVASNPAKNDAVRNGSVSLVLAHGSQAKDWDRLLEFTNQTLEKLHNNAAIYRSSREVRERAAIEKMRQASDAHRDAEVLKMGETFGKYCSSTRNLAWLYETAANAAANSGNLLLAQRYLALAYQTLPSSALRYRLTVLQGSAEEEQFHLKKAQIIYLDFFKSLKKEALQPHWLDLRARLEFLAIIDADPAFIEQLTATPSFCGKSFQTNCKLLAGFAQFISPHSRLSGHGSPTYVDRAKMFLAEGKDMKDLLRLQASFEREKGPVFTEKASAAYLAFSVFGRLIPKARRILTSARTDLRAKRPLTLKPASLSARLTALKKFESDCFLLMQSPVDEFNVAIRSELGLAFREMHEDSAALLEKLKLEPNVESDAVEALNELSLRFRKLADEKAASGSSPEFKEAAASATPVGTAITEAISSGKWASARYLMEQGEKRESITPEQATGIKHWIASLVIQGRSESSHE